MRKLCLRTRLVFDCLRMTENSQRGPRARAVQNKFSVMLSEIRLTRMHVQVRRASSTRPVWVGRPMRPEPGVRKIASTSHGCLCLRATALAFKSVLVRRIRLPS